jgi:hypothetical protein
MADSGDAQTRPDIEAAKSKMRSKFGANRELRKLPEHLWEGETVERITSGTYGSDAGTGIVALTDRRIIFLKDGWMSKTSEDFPIEKISSVQWSSGLMLGTLTIFASGNKAEIKNMQKVDGKEMADLVRSRLSGGAAAVPSPAPEPAGNPIIQQIRELGELRDAGLLSEVEFEAKKAELLKRI